MKIKKINSVLASGLLKCKKCGGTPTTLIGGGLLRPQYWWICSECGSKPKESATYSGAWDKWQNLNYFSN